MTFTATPLLVAEITGVSAQIGIIGALQLAPVLVFGLLAGTIADRSDQRWIMLWCQLGRGFLTALVPIAVFFKMSPVSMLMAVSFPVGTLGAMYQSAYRAAVPLIVHEEQVPTAASHLQTIITMGYIIGPAVAGMAAAKLGPAATFAIDAASFAISAIVLALIRPIGARARKSAMIDDLREGIAFTFGHPRMRVLVCLVVIEAVANAPLIPSLTMHCLHHGMTARTVGVAVSAGAMGAVAGFLTGNRLSRWRPNVVLLGSLAAAGMVNLFLGELTAAWWLIGAVFFSSAFNAGFLCLSLMLRMAATPHELAGRVGSAVGVLSVAAMAVGTLVGSMLIDSTSGGAVIRGSGVIFLLVSIFFLWSPQLRAATVVVTPSAEGATR